MTKQFEKLPQQHIEKEKEPKIVYHVLYSYHETAKDFSEFADAYRKCDIYIPEGSGWTKEIFIELNEMSQGERRPDEAKSRLGSSETTSEMFRVIYKSKKPIVFIDATWPKDHSLIEQLEQTSEGNLMAMSEFIVGHFEKAIEFKKSFLDKLKELYVEKREKIMAKNLKKRIKETIYNYPHLKNKSEIKVLLTLGSAHTSFYHWLKKHHLNAHQQIANHLQVFMSGTEFVRRKLFNRFNKETGDLLLAKSLIELFLYYHYREISDNNVKIVRVIRKITSTVNIKDVEQITRENKQIKEEICGQAKQLTEQQEIELIEAVQQNIIKYLKNKSIVIPTSEKEMDKIL